MKNMQKKKKKMPMQLWMKELVMLIMKWMMKYLTQHFCKEIERNNFNDSAETWGFSPIKPVGKRFTFNWVNLLFAL